jgi:hypothetical protein
MNKNLKVRWNNIELVKPKQGQTILLFNGNFEFPKPFPDLISGTYEIEDGEEYYETDSGYRQLSDYPHWAELYQLNLPQSNDLFKYFVDRGMSFYDIGYSSVKLDRTGDDILDNNPTVELMLKNEYGSRLITPIADVFKTQQQNMKKLNYE